MQYDLFTINILFEILCYVFLWHTINIHFITSISYTKTAVQSLKRCIIMYLLSNNQIMISRQIIRLLYSSPGEVMSHDIFVVGTRHTEWCTHSLHQHHITNSRFTQISLPCNKTCLDQDMFVT